MKKSLLFMCVLAVALASCSRGELPDEPVTPTPPDPGKEDLVEIRLQSAVNPLEANTKTPFIGDIASGNQLKAKVLKTTTTNGFVANNTNTSSSMTFEGSGTATGTWSDGKYYPIDDSPVYLCGLYPDDNVWVNNTDKTAMTYKFDGKTDVMAAQQVETKKSEAQQTIYQTLAFNHLLTNLIVKVKADLTDMTIADVQAAWGNITSIALSNVNGSVEPKNTVTVTLSSGAGDFSLVAPYGVSFYQASNKPSPAGQTLGELFTFTDNSFASLAIPDKETAVAYSMIAPVTSDGSAGTKEFTLLVSTGNQGDIKVPVDLTTSGSTQGKYCIVTLTFKNTTISATASVTAWADGGTADATIQ